MTPVPGGGLLIRLVEKTSTSPPAGFYRPRSGALLVSQDLSVVDTLMLFDDTEQFLVDAPWGPFGVAPPLGRGTHIAQGGNPLRFCLGDQKEPEITCVGPEGERRSIRWISEPGSVTADEVATWREATVQAYELKLSRQQVLAMLNQIPIPDSRPPFSGLHLDPAGNLWVEEGPAMGSLGDRTDFLVFDPQGVLLGGVAVPRLEVLEIGLDYVLGLHRDELEVEYLHLYRITKPAGESQ
jgi:hypothetical protein